MSFLDDWQLRPLSLERASGFTPIGLFVAVPIAVAVINPGWASAVAVGVLVAGAAFAIMIVFGGETIVVTPSDP